jgi:Tfp pilus assembly protein PilO
MPVQRPSLQKLLLQVKLNKFYAKPVARVSLGLVLSILTILFFAIVAIKPTLDTMAELIKQIEEKQQIDRKLSLKITALASAQTELATKEAPSAILDKAIPSTPDFNILLSMIEKIGSERGITFNSLLVTTVPKERSATISATTLTANNIESIPVSLSINGTYSQLFTALQDLQNLQRLVTIDRVEIVPPANSDDTNLNMTISLRAFALSNTPQTKKAPGK